MNTTWDAWMPDVMVHATTAPDPLARQALCRAAREFFQRTRSWMVWLDPIVSEAGSGVEYSLDLPPQSNVVRIERATRNGNPLDVTSFREKHYDWMTERGGEQALVSSDLITFVLNGDFPRGDRMQVQVSLTPSLRAAGVPSSLASVNFEAIAEGAKAILLLIPGTGFYQPELAVLSRRTFDQKISEASIAAYRGHTNHIPRASVIWC